MDSAYTTVFYFIHLHCAVCNDNAGAVRQTSIDSCFDASNLYVERAEEPSQVVLLFGVVD
jgi:hypothetical protein